MVSLQRVDCPEVFLALGVVIVLVGRDAEDHHVLENLISASFKLLRGGLFNRSSGHPLLMLDNGVKGFTKF